MLKEEGQTFVLAVKQPSAFQRCQTNHTQPLPYIPTLYLTLADTRKAHDPDHAAVMKRKSPMKRYAVYDADNQSVVENKVVADGDDAPTPH